MDDFHVGDLVELDLVNYRTTGEITDIVASGIVMEVCFIDQTNRSISTWFHRNQLTKIGTEQRYEVLGDHHE